MKITMDINPAIGIGVGFDNFRKELQIFILCFVIVFSFKKSRGSAVGEQRIHNPSVAGSSPAPATGQSKIFS